MSITVICSKPGFRRAGMAHPARAKYDEDHFTDEQWEALKADPKFTLVTGDVVSDTPSKAETDAVIAAIRVAIDKLEEGKEPTVANLKPLLDFKPKGVDIKAAMKSADA